PATKGSRAIRSIGGGIATDCVMASPNRTANEINEIGIAGIVYHWSRRPRISIGMVSQQPSQRRLFGLSPSDAPLVRGSKRSETLYESPTNWTGQCKRYAVTRDQSL